MQLILLAAWLANLQDEEFSVPIRQIWIEESGDSTLMGVMGTAEGFPEGVVLRFQLFPIEHRIDWVKDRIESTIGEIPSVQTRVAVVQGTYTFRGRIQKPLGYQMVCQYVPADQADSTIVRAVGLHVRDWRGVQRVWPGRFHIRVGEFERQLSGFVNLVAEVKKGVEEEDGGSGKGDALESIRTRTTQWLARAMIPAAAQDFHQLIGPVSLLLAGPSEAGGEEVIYPIFPPTGERLTLDRVASYLDRMCRYAVKEGLLELVDEVEGLRSELWDLYESQRVKSRPHELKSTLSLVGQDVSSLRKAVGLLQERMGSGIPPQRGEEMDVILSHVDEMKDTIREALASAREGILEGKNQELRSSLQAYAESLR